MQKLFESDKKNQKQIEVFYSNLIRKVIDLERKSTLGFNSHKQWSNRMINFINELETRFISLTHICYGIKINKRICEKRNGIFFVDFAEDADHEPKS